MLSTFESVKIKFEVRLSNEFDKTDGPNGIRDQTLNSTKLTLNASLG